MNEIICGPDLKGKPTCDCGVGNPTALDLGGAVELTNGTQAGPSYDAMRDNCWLGSPRLDLHSIKTSDGVGKDNIPDQPWEITIPVVKCNDTNNVGICDQLVGAVTVRVVWITDVGEDSLFKDAPRRMGDWPPVGDPLRGANGSCTGTGKACWNSSCPRSSARTSARSEGT